jgi:hypothetical protein
MSQQPSELALCAPLVGVAASEPPGAEHARHFGPDSATHVVDAMPRVELELLAPALGYLPAAAPTEPFAIS